MFQPRLLLMDEPLGALDKQLREQMQIEIKHIQQSLGITAVYVTHDQQEALTMSDRIAVFHEGGIQQLDTPEAIYERPATAFVAGFVGESNWLDGTVARRGDADCLVDTQAGPIIAAAADALPPGAAARILIRPERAALDPASTPGNRVDAVVEEVIYQGDVLRIRLAVAGRVDFIVKRPNTGRSAAPAVGARVTIGWAAADARAFAT